MRGKFATLMTTTILALNKKIDEEEIEMDSLKTLLILKDRDREKQYSNAQSVKDLMKVIREDSFFTNPYHLESLTLEFNLKEVQEKVEMYSDDLEDYYDQVLAEDFVQEILNQYDKVANIEVSKKV